MGGGGRGEAWTDVVEIISTRVVYMHTCRQTHTHTCERGSATSPASPTRRPSHSSPSRILSLISLPLPPSIPLPSLPPSRLPSLPPSLSPPFPPTHLRRSPPPAFPPPRAAADPSPPCSPASAADRRRAARVPRRVREALAWHCRRDRWALAESVSVRARRGSASDTRPAAAAPKTPPASRVTRSPSGRRRRAIEVKPPCSREGSVDLTTVRLGRGASLSRGASQSECEAAAAAAEGGPSGRMALAAPVVACGSAPLAGRRVGGGGL